MSTGEFTGELDDARADDPIAAQQPAQVVESNGGIRATAEYPADKLSSPAHVRVPALTDPGTERRRLDASKEYPEVFREPSSDSRPATVDSR